MEFQRAAELLDDKLEAVGVKFYDYKTDVTFDKYQRLLSDGFIERGNAFSIEFTHRQSGVPERFMFRYYRNPVKFYKSGPLIPLELNYFDRAQARYIRLSEVSWADRIRLREVFFNKDGEFLMRYYNLDLRQEAERKAGTIAEAVQWFYDDVLQNIFHLG